MEKRLNWKDNLVKAAGIPEDLAYGQPVVTVTGQRRLQSHWDELRK